MNIIITGGLGFVGSHLVEQLSNEKIKLQYLQKVKRKYLMFPHFIKI